MYASECEFRRVSDELDRLELSRELAAELRMEMALVEMLGGDTQPPEATR
jgi:hypothetical protein